MTIVKTPLLLGMLLLAANVSCHQKAENAQQTRNVGAAETIQQTKSMNIQEGKWEFTVEQEISGMPMKMPSVKFTKCVTSETSMIPVEVENDCKIIAHKVSGNTVTYSVVCRDADGEMQIKGKATYKGDTMEAESKITMKDEDEDMQITSRIKGKYIGKCDKK